MKTKSRIWISLIIGMLICFTISCTKEDPTSPVNKSTDKSSAVFNTEKTYGILTDYDGNEYKTIAIGSQIWMAENLRTTHYRNGDTIIEVNDHREWGSIGKGAYFNYKNSKNSDTLRTYGRLYNWSAITDNRKITPLGWHLPSDTEWKILTDYLGGEDSAGCKLKEVGSYHWCDENSDATNESGFTALPSGFLTSSDDTVTWSLGGWWTSDEFDNGYVWGRGVYCSGGDVLRNIGSKNNGLSVRLVKD